MYWKIALVVVICFIFGGMIGAIAGYIGAIFVAGVLEARREDKELQKKMDIMKDFLNRKQ